MSQNTIEHACLELLNHHPANAPTKMRYERIVQARRDIVEGVYDDDAAVDAMLDRCMDKIVNDLARA